MSENTPGPWRVDNNRVLRAGDADDAPSLGVVYPMLDGRDNRPLIAASPDLLAILQDIAEYADQGMPDPMNDRVIVDRVNAVIRKATGSES